MNCNPHMSFSEQDYHLLKTHQSSGGSGIKQESLEDITKISFDNQHNYMFDIACNCYIGGNYSFNGTAGCNVIKIGSANPTNVGNISRMIITVITDIDNGTKGQIEWGGVKWNITCSSSNSWTIGLPSGYHYYGIKTEVGNIENEI